MEFTLVFSSADGMPDSFGRCLRAVIQNAITEFAEKCGVNIRAAVYCARTVLRLGMVYYSV